MARYAIKTPPQHARWEDILAIWRAADEIDLFESAWNFDHLYPLRSHPSGTCLEAWVTLSALAQATSRIRLGCMVHGMHFRHPSLTANMAATLDIVSGGRLYLGLGAGWYEEEARTLGFELGTVKERMDRFEEGVEVIVRLLSQETTSFSGEHYRLEDAYCEPKGPQQPHPPIAIGGKGEKRTLRVVARWAQWWDSMRTEPEEWKRLRDVLAGYCEEIGRDRSDITTSGHIGYGKGGDPREAVGKAAALFDTGVDVAIFSLQSPYDAAMVEELADAIAAA